MFRTINQKFYTIASVLVFLFCLSYIQVAYFINQQSRIAAQGEEIVGLERDIHKLLSLFFRLRYWERAVFAQDFPDAEQHFGQIIVQMNALLSTLKTPVSRDLHSAGAGTGSQDPCLLRAGFQSAASNQYRTPLTAHQTQFELPIADFRHSRQWQIEPFKTTADRNPFSNELRHQQSRH